MLLSQKKWKIMWKKNYSTSWTFDIKKNNVTNYWYHSEFFTMQKVSKTLNKGISVMKCKWSEPIRWKQWKSSFSDVQYKKQKDISWLFEQTNNTQVFVEERPYI